MLLKLSIWHVVLTYGYVTDSLFNFLKRPETFNKDLTQENCSYIVQIQMHLVCSTALSLSNDTAITSDCELITPDHEMVYTWLNVTRCRKMSVFWHCGQTLHLKRR